MNGMAGGQREGTAGLGRADESSGRKLVLGAAVTGTGERQCWGGHGPHPKNYRGLGGRLFAQCVELPACDSELP